MARRSGGTNKGVEEKRKSLPIYHHYTLSPGKTKSHHPEAKCNHCLKEFVCGSKQRLIRHLRKCGSITNKEQIIAETLNNLVRNSATGTLNHSILEAANLLPSQVNQHIQQHHHNSSQQHSQHHSANTSTTANNTSNSNNNHSNHNNTGSSCNDLGASTSNGSGFVDNNMGTPVKRPAKRGRKPANQFPGSGLQVITGPDGKTHFQPASQPLTNQGQAGPSGGVVNNGGYTTYSAVTSTPNPINAVTPGAHLQANSGHMACATQNHHISSSYKPLNSETIDKAYLKLVLTRNLPLSLCDTREFQVWVKTFANDYKPPSSINLVAQNLKNEAQAARQRIANVLIKAPKKTINLELHTWPDDMRRWYAVVATIDHKRFLISVKDIHLTGNPQLLRSITNNITNSDGTGADDVQIVEPVLPEEKMLTDFIDECIKRVGSDRINSLKFVGRVEDDVLAPVVRKFLYSAHPSIVTYYCWWHFTNLLCSDIIHHNEAFQDVMRNSNRLINFVNQRPTISQNLEKFRPFSGVTGSIRPKQSDRRWYSHLVCYLLEYIRNNQEAIVEAIESYSTHSSAEMPLHHQSQLSSDNNNNDGQNNDVGQIGGSHLTDPSTQQHQQQVLTLHEDDEFTIEIKSIVMSPDYWSNLNLALTYLKPIHDIVALTSIVTPTPPKDSNSTNQSEDQPTSAKQNTPSISQTTATNMSLSDYMHWFLTFGKTLLDDWQQSTEITKHQLIANYLSRFSNSLDDFKLPIAAYLLNPKYRCAFMTQKAKDDAIVQILDIASEFMPEESDGHTIFDQWKLYLLREEPYDMVFDDAKQSPIDWWVSLLCPESIRRVALRILRFKAFTTPKPETLFSQLYFYEDETRSSLDSSTFEDVAILRYFYDYEDKIGQPSAHGGSHGFSNGTVDRSQIGYQHNSNLNQSSQSSRYLPSGPMDTQQQDNQAHTDDPMSDGDGRFQDALSEVVVDPYLNHHHQQLNMNSEQMIANMPEYHVFKSYVDYTATGVQIVEEPTERKRKKWTAQEILSKCMSHSNNNNSATDTSSK